MSRPVVVAFDTYGLVTVPIESTGTAKFRFGVSLTSFTERTGVPVHDPRNVRERTHERWMVYSPPPPPEGNGPFRIPYGQRGAPGPKVTRFGS
jgi:hypothetical protein